MLNHLQSHSGAIPTFSASTPQRKTNQPAALPKTFPVQVKGTAAPPLSTDAFRPNTSKQAGTPVKGAGAPLKFKGNWLTGWWNSGNLPKATPPSAKQKEFIPEKVEKTDAKRLAIAQNLSQWMHDTLKEKNAKMAVVSRNGDKQIEQHDPTGMAHSGMAVLVADNQGYQIYNLLYDESRNPSTGEPPKSSLYITEPVDFFYRQAPLKEDALLLIPKQDVQERVIESLKSGKHKPLYFTKDYNLVSPPETQQSLNCNKWVLMHLIAAQTGIYKPENVLRHIQNSYKPGMIHVNPFLRPFAKQQASILGAEVPWIDPIRTVTVESLYRSGLFEERIFKSGRKLDPVTFSAPAIKRESPATARSTQG